MRTLLKSVVVGALAIVLLDTSVWAQARKPGGAAVNRAEIDRQKAGVYPKLERDTLPLGAINQRWASSKCGQESTTVAVAYNPSSEIRFKVRQLLGTVVAFPEAVEVVSAPGGTGFRAEPHGDSDTSSNLWIFGSTKAGLDGNYVFVGKGGGAPVLYLLHIQSEGYNTKSCPDLMVLVQPPIAKGLGRAASALQEWMTAMNVGSGTPVRAVPVNSVPTGYQKGKAATPDMSVGNTGRGEKDWLESKPFDPSQLKFDWRVYGEASLAPDIVYSDGVFTYLKFSGDRLETIRVAAISAVEQTKHGGIDSPVNWSIKGDTIVVQGIQRLTLEREGLVTCVVPEGLPAPGNLDATKARFNGRSTGEY